MAKSFPFSKTFKATQRDHDYGTNISTGSCLMTLDSAHALMNTVYTTNVMKMARTSASADLHVEIFSSACSLSNVLFPI